MGSFAYALKILLVVVILVSLKLNNCFEISKFSTLRIKAAIDRFDQACQADTRGGRIHINRAILLWDVLKSYAGIFKSLPCPFCERNGRSSLLVRCGIWTDGTTKTPYPPGIIHDTSAMILLVSGVYTCRNNR